MKKLLLTMMLSSLSFAAPAYHGEMEFIQNDGSKFSGHLKGDEYFSWVEDKQGNVIKFNKVSKNYEYAKLQMSQGEVDIVPSGVKVMNAKVPFSPSLSGQNISKEKISEIWKRKKEKVKFHH